MDRSPIDLEALTIASPCTVPWDSMAGDERKRFCGQCRLHVHDVSQMTRDEADALIEASGGRCCLRLWRRSDGRVITKDCGRVRAAIERRVRVLRAVAAGLFAAIGFGGCRSNPVPRGYRTTGVIAPGAARRLVDPPRVQNPPPPMTMGAPMPIYTNPNPPAK